MLVHEARQVEGQWQIGPLLNDPSGEVIGTGVRADGLEEILAKIQTLPVAERAHLEEQHFASMLLDWEGRKAFVTIEFPLDKEVRSTWSIPQRGKRKQGFLTKAPWRESLRHGALPNFSGTPWERNCSAGVSGTQALCRIPCAVLCLRKRTHLKSGTGI